MLKQPWRSNEICKIVRQTSLKPQRITDDEYDKFYQSFREQLSDTDTRLTLLQEAEDNYYITAKYLLDLANRAYDLFVGSELEEKRQLINLVLKNLKLDGKTVKFEAIKPFDTLLAYPDYQPLLPEPRPTIPENYASIVQTFQNLSYVAEMRQRWEEIKKLQIHYLL